MKLHRWNGERWWVDDRSVVGRVRRWVLWPGGWETFRSWPLRERLHPRHWTPFALLGHRITCYGWGWEWTLKRRGHWVASRSGGGPTRIYFSPDGTPDSATIWLRRPPRHVIHAANDRPREHELNLMNERKANA